eukprot:TRINITY_DN9561_c0_g1_i1.p1 TRINITY_DN9561_c0_g1~~TRINITY_DN9561_c0_g1_i1.p1  ORF type:complete len:562 (+),score=206.31 TRINITY_DN9561_c0_g1_i1:440-2125(+)
MSKKLLGTIPWKKTKKAVNERVVPDDELSWEERWQKKDDECERLKEKIVQLANLMISFKEEQSELKKTAEDYDEVIKEREDLEKLLDDKTKVVDHIKGKVAKLIDNNAKLKKALRLKYRKVLYQNDGDEGDEALGNRTEKKDGGNEVLKLLDSDAVLRHPQEEAEARSADEEETEEESTGVVREMEEDGVVSTDEEDSEARSDRHSPKKTRKRRTKSNGIASTESLSKSQDGEKKRKRERTRRKKKHRRRGDGSGVDSEGNTDNDAAEELEALRQIKSLIRRRKEKDVENSSNNESGREHRSDDGGSEGGVGDGGGVDGRKRSVEDESRDLNTGRNRTPTMLLDEIIDTTNSEVRETKQAGSHDDDDSDGSSGDAVSVGMTTHRPVKVKKKKRKMRRKVDADESGDDEEKGESKEDGKKAAPRSLRIDALSTKANCDDLGLETATSRRIKEVTGSLADVESMLELLGVGDDAADFVAVEERRLSNCEINGVVDDAAPSTSDVDREIDALLRDAAGDDTFASDGGIETDDPLDQVLALLDGDGDNDDDMRQLFESLDELRKI